MNPGEYAAMFAVEDRHWWYVGVRREVERALARLAGAAGRRPRILDAGCGTGGLVANLRTAAWKVGVEVSPEGVRLARARQIPLVQASVSSLPFADGVFDAVVSIDVLCHSGVDERLALAETSRVLRPGGLFVVQVPAFDALRSEHDAAVWTKRRYRRADVGRMLAASGLDSRRAAYRNALLFPFAALARLVRRGRRARDTARSDVRPVSRPLNALLSAILALERKVAKRWPFGLSVFCVAQKPTSAGDTIAG